MMIIFMKFDLPNLSLLWREMEGGLQFYINLFLIQIISENPVETYEKQRINQRCRIIAEDGLQQVIVNAAFQTGHFTFGKYHDITDDDGQHRSQYLHKQRIHPKSFEKAAPSFITFHINNPDKQGK